METINTAVVSTKELLTNATMTAATDNAITATLTRLKRFDLFLFLFLRPVIPQLETEIRLNRARIIEGDKRIHS